MSTEARIYDAFKPVNRYVDGRDSGDGTIIDVTANVDINFVGGDSGPSKVLCLKIRSLTLNYGASADNPDGGDPTSNPTLRFGAPDSVTHGGFIDSRAVNFCGFCKVDFYDFRTIEIKIYIIGVFEMFWMVSRHHFVDCPTDRNMLYVVAAEMGLEGLVMWNGHFYSETSFVINVAFANLAGTYWESYGLNADSHTPTSGVFMLTDLWMCPDAGVDYPDPSDLGGQAFGGGIPKGSKFSWNSWLFMQAATFSLSDLHFNPPDGAVFADTDFNNVVVYGAATQNNNWITQGSIPGLGDWTSFPCFDPADMSCQVQAFGVHIMDITSYVVHGFNDVGLVDVMSVTQIHPSGFVVYPLNVPDTFCVTAVAYRKMGTDTWHPTGGFQVSTPRHQHPPFSCPNTCSFPWNTTLADYDECGIPVTFVENGVNSSPFAVVTDEDYLIKVFANGTEIGSTTVRYVVGNTTVIDDNGTARCSQVPAICPCGNCPCGASLEVIVDGVMPCNSCGG